MPFVPLSPPATTLCRRCAPRGVYLSALKVFSCTVIRPGFDALDLAAMSSVLLLETARHGFRVRLFYVLHPVCCNRLQSLL